MVFVLVSEKHRIQMPYAFSEYLASKVRSSVYNEALSVNLHMDRGTGSFISVIHGCAYFTATSDNGLVRFLYLEK